MKQEFITSRGKIIIENDTVFVKTLKPEAYTFIFTILFPLLAIGVAIVELFSAEDSPRHYFRLFIWSAFAMTQMPKLYDSLIRRSYSTRIPVHKILSFELKPDHAGLETELILKLRSGRLRTIMFRTLEGQFESFTKVLSEHMAHSQLHQHLDQPSF